MAKQDRKNSFWQSISSEMKAVIITGLFGVLTLAITKISDVMIASSESKSAQTLMRKEFEYKLLMKVFGEKDKREAAKMLEFFVDINFLEDETGNIKQLAKDPSLIPFQTDSRIVLSSRNNVDLRELIESGGLSNIVELDSIMSQPDQ